MASIDQRQFVRILGQRSGALNVSELSARTRETLSRAQITASKLARIAGRDNQVHGKEELEKLFDSVDAADRDGSSASIRIRDANNQATASGAVFEALKREVAEHRAMSHRRGVLHVGMRSASSREAQRLRQSTRRDGGTVTIQAAESKGVVEHRSILHDLKTSTGRRSFFHSIKADGMEPRQANRFLAFIENQRDISKDEVAELGLALYRAGVGSLPISRLVLSGHSVGQSIYGDDGGEISFLALATLTEIFSLGAAKVEHLATSACNSGFPQQLEAFRDMFPNLKSYFGYAGFAPSAEKGAPAHLAAWERMTDGDDPSQVVPLPGTPTTTWSKVNGFRPLGIVMSPASPAEQEGVSRREVQLSW